MTETHIMQKLREQADKDSSLCVGLDTSPSYIPEYIIKTIGSQTEAVLTYNLEIIRRIASSKSACCSKIQIAYYEAMGLEGLKIYSQTLNAVKEAGLIAISDIKRGDIADTAAAYAKAHFSGDFETDIITVNPYMGFDTLQPFYEYSMPQKGGKGIFVLLRTSNPGMKDIEQQELKSGGRVLDKTANALNSIAERFSQIYPNAECSPVGAVVGCTEESDAKLLREACPNIFFLIPGYGAQGGSARIAGTLLAKAGGVVNSSRGILCAWQKDNDLREKREAGCLCMSDIADSAAKAALIAKEDLSSAQNIIQQNQRS